MEPFIGQIQGFGFNFAPKNWAQCNGQILQISQNNALFALLGNIYGGDGRTTFALPDLRGRIPVHRGQAPYSGTNITMGRRVGSQYVTLNKSNLPSHEHVVAQNTLAARLRASTSGNNVSESGDGENGLASGGSTPAIYTTNPNFTEYLPSASTEVSGSVQANSAGGNLPIPVSQPFLAVNYCISLQGLFPSRN